MSIARNTSYMLASTLAGLAATLITAPIYLQVIGPERYGILAILWTFVIYFGLVDLGVARAAVQQLARIWHVPEKRDDPAEGRAAIFWTAMGMNMVLGLIAGAAFYAAYSSLTGSLKFDDPAVLAEVQQARPVMALLLPVMILNSVLAAPLLATERFGLMALLRGVDVLGTTVLPLLVAIWISMDMGALVGVVVGLRVVLFVLFAIMATRTLGAAARPRRPQKALARRLLSFGLWVTVTNIVGPILSGFDRIAIGAVIGVALVPFYTVPQGLFQRLVILPQALAQVLFPRFSRDMPAADQQALALRALEVVRITMVPVCAVALVLVDPFLRLWFSPEFAARATPVALVVILGGLLNGMARIMVSLLLGRGRPDFIAKVHLAELLPYLGVLYLLIHSFGILGAALAWSLRVAVDLALMAWAAGFGRAVLRMTAGPLVALGALAFLVAWLPAGGGLYWALGLPICAGAVIWALVFMPSDLIALARTLPAGRLLTALAIHRKPEATS